MTKKTQRRGKQRDLIAISAQALIQNPVLATLAHDQLGQVMLLLCRMAVAGDDQSLPDEPERMARLLSVSPDAWAALRHELLHPDCGAFWSQAGRLGCFWLSEPPVAHETLPVATETGTDAQKFQRQLRQEWEALFDSHFWPAVWKKHDKQNARKAWNKLCPASPEAGQQLLDAIMAGVERYKTFLTANPDRSVKYPQGWLNGRRWEDEFDQQDMTGTRKDASQKSALDRMLDSMREEPGAQEGFSPIPGNDLTTQGLFGYGDERF